MTDHAESFIPSPGRYRGVAYALASAALAAALLFLPVLLLGYTIQVVVSVATGEVLAWQSSVGMTYAFLGMFAIVSTLLLLIPFLLWRAAAGIIGRAQATLWTGGVLAAALAGVAVVWLVQAQLRSSHASQPEYWYALAFAASAAFVLLASVLVARRATVALLAVLAAAAAGVLVLVATLVAVWGTTRIPADAQRVEVNSTPSGVEVRPDTVHAGPVYFIADGGGDPSGHGEITFVSGGYAESSDYTDPLPMTEERIQALRRGDYQGTSLESGSTGYWKATLNEGYYAFIIGGSAGEEPGVAPQSVAVLEVRP